MSKQTLNQRIHRQRLRTTSKRVTLILTRKNSGFNITWNGILHETLVWNTSTTLVYQFILKVSEQFYRRLYT